MVTYSTELLIGQIALIVKLFMFVDCFGNGRSEPIDRDPMTSATSKKCILSNHLHCKRKRLPCLGRLDVFYQYVILGTCFQNESFTYQYKSN